MNYLEWSREYEQTAAELEKVIEKLKAKRKSSSPSQKKDIDSRIAQFRIYSGECRQIARHLLERHGRAA